MIKKSEIKTLFCMSDLEDLGIQRVICWILNNWEEKEYDLVGLSLNRKKGKLKEFLNSKIKVYEVDRVSVPLPGGTFLFRIYYYLMLLRRLRPQKVIAVNQSEALALCIVKRFFPNFKLVVCEHCHVSSNINGADAHKGFFGWYYKRFFQREYSKYADVIHTVSFESAEDLIQNFKFTEDQVKVIYNPIDLLRVKGMSQEGVEEEWLNDKTLQVFLSASRISPQKRIDILLKAWSLFLSKDKVRNLKYRLIICGEGDSKEEMIQLCKDLGVSQYTKFIGFQSNPWKFMGKADFFISTSEWEGLSCSLIEAQSLGVPILASNCPSGNKEILMNGNAGFLFENKNVTSCVAVMEQLISSSEEEIYEKIDVAYKNMDRFNIKRIVKQYYEL